MSLIKKKIFDTNFLVKNTPLSAANPTACFVSFPIALREHFTLGTFGGSRAGSVVGRCEKTHSLIFFFHFLVRKIIIGNNKLKVNLGVFLKKKKQL